MSSLAAERISELLLLTISELETNLVSIPIKHSNSQQIIEEIQTCVHDYRNKFLQSINQLIQFLSQQCPQYSKEILKFQDSLEQQTVKYQQKQLLYQMKALVNQKIKALLDTLNYSSNQNQKKEVVQHFIQKQFSTQIQKQLQLLTDSLQKIESTLSSSSTSSSFQHSPPYITPLPRRMFQYSQSQEQMTPNLSDQAQKMGKLDFLTPEQYREYQQLTYANVQEQNLHTPFSQNILNHFSIDRTLNSFNNEHIEGATQFQQQQSEHIHQLFQIAFNCQNPPTSEQLPNFGQQEKEIHFENQMIENYLAQVPIYESMLPTKTDESHLLQTSQSEIEIHKIDEIETKLIVQQEQQQQSPQLAAPSKQSNSQRKNSLMQVSQLSISKQKSTKSVSIHNKNNLSPQVRLVQSTKPKQSLQRNSSQLESVNLLTKLNSVTDQATNKENLQPSQSTQSQKASKLSKPTISSQQKQLKPAQKERHDKFKKSTIK